MADQAVFLLISSSVLSFFRLNNKCLFLLIVTATGALDALSPDRGRRHGPITGMHQVRRWVSRSAAVMMWQYWCMSWGNGMFWLYEVEFQCGIECMFAYFVNIHLKYKGNYGNWPLDIRVLLVFSLLGYCSKLHSPCVPDVTHVLIWWPGVPLRTRIKNRWSGTSLSMSPRTHQRQTAAAILCCATVKRLCCPMTRC